MEPILFNMQLSFALIACFNIAVCAVYEVSLFINNLLMKDCEMQQFKVMLYKDGKFERILNVGGEYTWTRVKAIAEANNFIKRNVGYTFTLENA
jgi:hypothetical protein